MPRCSRQRLHVHASKASSDRWTLLVTHAGDEVVRVVPFEAIELHLADLWID